MSRRQRRSPSRASPSAATQSELPQQRPGPLATTATAPALLVQFGRRQRPDHADHEPAGRGHPERVRADLRAHSLNWRSTTTVAVFDPDHPTTPGGTRPSTTRPCRLRQRLRRSHERIGDVRGTRWPGLPPPTSRPSVPSSISCSPKASTTPRSRGHHSDHCGGADATLTATISGGSGSYSYQWVSGQRRLLEARRHLERGRAPITTQYLMTGTDTVRLLITDTCGRQGISRQPGRRAPTIDLDANNSTGRDGGRFPGLLAGGDRGRRRHRHADHRQRHDDRLGRHQADHASGRQRETLLIDTAWPPAAASPSPRTAAAASF